MAAATPGAQPGSIDLEVIARRIAEPGLDVRQKIGWAEHVRDSLDSLRDQDTARYIQVMLPVVTDVLRNGQPATRKDAPEQILRHVLLELCHRHPHHDAFKQVVSATCATMLQVMRVDHEDNAIVALKIFADLARSYKQLTEVHMAPFIDLFAELLDGAGKVASEVFSEACTATDPPPTVCVPAARSFKFISEYPITIILILQVHRENMLQTFQKLVPVTVKHLQYEAPAQKVMHVKGDVRPGPNPALQNKATFSDFVNTQIKAMSFLAYVHRSYKEVVRPHAEHFAASASRVLLDIPVDSIAMRREMLTGLRHVLNVEQRAQFYAQFDLLTDERVLLGRGIGSIDALRPTAFFVLTDIIQFVRPDLQPRQIQHLLRLLATGLHNTALNAHTNIIITKTIMTLIEVIAAKFERPEAGAVLFQLFECFADKITAIKGLRQEYIDMKLSKKDDRAEAGDGTEYGAIERSKPILGEAFTVYESLADCTIQYRNLFRTLLAATKNVLWGMKQAEAPRPDAELMGRYFVDALHCMNLFAGATPADQNEENLANEQIVDIFKELNLLVFQEIWVQNLAFYLELIPRQPKLLIIMQSLLTTNDLSSIAIGLLLKHLLQDIDALGSMKDATVPIRMFKMAFVAVTGNGGKNEAILAPHLSKLIMESLSLATRAEEPANYYMLLRGLFRAIGGAAGRFELLYKEVLPLLPEMLETLNKQLDATPTSDTRKRDMIVELCLTVPVRLTHLVPHLRYLMDPLVLSLQGPPELISQGLRTLELCLDNLQPEFLDPALRPVLPKLVRAISLHLKPLPAPHTVAHNALRILGKLGGKNRLLLHDDPVLDYRVRSDPVAQNIPFGSSRRVDIDMGPVSALANNQLQSDIKQYRDQAFALAKHCMQLALAGDIREAEYEQMYHSTIHALVEALIVEESRQEIVDYLRSLGRHILTMEIAREIDRETASVTSGRRMITLYCNIFMERVLNGLASPADSVVNVVSDLFNDIISDVLSVKEAANGKKIRGEDRTFMIHQLALRCQHMCHDDAWMTKVGGSRGFQLLLRHPAKPERAWLSGREIEIGTALNTVLKTIPPESSSSIIMETTKQAALECSKSAVDNLVLIDPSSVQFKQRYEIICAYLTPELGGGYAPVRDVAYDTVKYLAQKLGKTANDIIHPYRQRILNHILTIPLRTLPVQRQMENMDAMTFLLNLETPVVPENGDELLRVLHEAIGLADAEDSSLVNRYTARQSVLIANNVRICGIRLMTASLPVTDCYAKQIQTRQKVVSVYFKALYSPHQPIKDAAREGLKCLTAHNTRLPREFLQSGLRPILQNLADTKALTAHGLEGLARLMELLTNYFRVELGQRLVQHFKTLADPANLAAAAGGPLMDNDSVVKLVRLLDIFHLLPQTANLYLSELLDEVVKTEHTLQSASPSPLSFPMGKYLNRYPQETVENFFSKLDDPRFVRTLRNIILSKTAPALLAELDGRTSDLIAACFTEENRAQILSGLQLVLDMIAVDSEYIKRHGEIVDALIEIWRNEFSSVEDKRAPLPPQWVRLALQVFMKSLQSNKRIEILFDIYLVHQHAIALDLSTFARFVHKEFITSTDVQLRRNAVMLFVDWLSSPERAHSISHLTRLLHYLVIPMLHVSLIRQDEIGDAGLLSTLFEHLFVPGKFDNEEDLLKVDILHLSTILVQYRAPLVNAARKDVIKTGWEIGNKSDDVTVKQCSNIFLSRFYDAFEAPAKFVIGTLSNLLRSQSAEGRVLTKQALDILIPALPKRLINDDGPQSWPRFIRRLLNDDAQSGTQQWALIYSLVVRHRDVFYPHRAMFIPHMIGSFTKFGLSLNSSFETRTVCLDLVDVILNWERSAATESLSADGKTIYITPLTQRESLVSFLVRLVVQTTVSDGSNPIGVKQTEIIHSRALGLLKEISGPDGWQEVTVKLNFFARTLDSHEINQATVAHMNNAARLLNVISAEKPASWFLANAQTLHKLLHRGLVSEETALHDNLLPIFKRLVELFPPTYEDEDVQNPLPEFHAFIDQAINDGLRSPGNPRGPVLMLQALVEVAPRKLEPFGQHLTKLLARYSRDHVMPGNTEITVRMLRAILDICRMGVAHLSDQRKNLLTCTILLIEKSPSVPFCQYLLNITREWVLKSREPYPTMKEKANLLLKMQTFETRDEALFHDYLSLIHEIYTDPSLRRTDLTQRLEPAFFVGCRAKNLEMRSKFVDLLDASIATPLTIRLNYIFAVQSWEPLADHQWLHVALELLLGSVDNDVIPALGGDNLAGDAAFLESTSGRHIQSFVQPLRRLLFVDAANSGKIWISLFSSIWSTLSRKEQTDLSSHITSLLTREYHIKQAEARPNIIQTLLEGLHACSPSIALPPFLIKYLGKTFGAWHIAIAMLEHAIDKTFVDDEPLRQTCLDSVIELYADISEDDMFYGAWRTRNLYPDTSQAIVFEQHGMWYLALQHYEAAMTKARTGAQNYTEQEYSMWEDHYIFALQKLQVWDIVHDLSKSLDDKDLWLEAMWRQDWNPNKDQIESELSTLSDVATPRRKIFEAFVALQKNYSGEPGKPTEFVKILEEAMQLSLRKWVSLPSNLCAAHIPLLQHFQQFVELAEASGIFASLAGTNAANLEKKSGELKHLLISWRERLPNIEDDIMIWSDLVYSRQHVFEMINTAYLPLIQSQANPPNNASTFGYRGYHETAWTINRYAHIARKHYLLEVCHSALNKIYTLPNIEIAEAFRKLREQARCFYQTTSELQQGLEVINNTNLSFFSTQQKAEFFTLKGMFFHKLGRPDEAKSAFSAAVQLDIYQPKAWAQFAKYHDTLLQEQPTDLSHAASAISCYIQAALLLSNAKSRPFWNRILWLLSYDDGSSDLIEKTFAQHKDMLPGWYFLTLIPQLVAALQHRDARYVQPILIAIAKTFPQAIYYHVRALREEFLVRRQEHARRMPASQLAQPTSPIKVEPGESERGSPATDTVPSPQPMSAERLQTSPFEATVEHLFSIIKSSHPLLQITMERLSENLVKCRETPDEAAYRIISALLAESVASTNLRSTTFGDDMAVPPLANTNIEKVAHSNAITGVAQAEFKHDFVISPPTNMRQYVEKLQHWRDRYERALNERPRSFSIEYVNSYLASFHFTKLNEIEVPGQYLQHADDASQFIRIAQLGPKFELVRGGGLFQRRFQFIGHDGSRHAFVVQFGQRLARREERVQQIFRSFNSVVVRRKETRRRSLTFNVPIALQISFSCRLVESDDAYVSMQDIYDQFCTRAGFTRETPSLMYADKYRAVQESSGRTIEKNRVTSVRMDILNEIGAKLVPETVLSEYMRKSMKTPTDLWLVRKQFASQLAAASFITYVVSLPMRTPQRLHVSRRTGLVMMSEMFPAFVQGKAVLASPAEHVPWRFTPSIQHFIGRIGIEGVFVTSLVAFGRALTEPEHNLERELPLYMRDEVYQWLREHQRQPGEQLVRETRETVNVNVAGIVSRTEQLACKDMWENTITNGNQTAVQPVIQIISQCTMPQNLALMKHEFYPWF